MTSSKKYEKNLYNYDIFYNFAARKVRSNFLIPVLVYSIYVVEYMYVHHLQYGYTNLKWTAGTEIEDKSTLFPY